MLQRSKSKEMCQCCCGITHKWTYQLGNFRYCAQCLHSVGFRTTGEPCGQGEYDRAWRELAGESP